MDKEEILKRSRQENSKRDEMETKIRFDAQRYSLLAGVAALVLISAYRTFVLRDTTMQLEIYIVIAGAAIINQIYLYAKLKKRRNLITLVVFAVLFVIGLILCLR